MKWFETKFDREPIDLPSRRCSFNELEDYWLKEWSSVFGLSFISCINLEIIEFGIWAGMNLCFP